MGSKLKSIDLTGAVVGTTGIMDFNQFPKFNPQTMDKAHLRLLNESGCGIDVKFNASGNAHFLPAGAWGTFDLEPNDASINVSVAYVLPNPPVSSLIGIYYRAGEQVPQAFTLGNSPIGIGGTVTTSSVQTLSNEGNPAGTLIIDFGPASQQVSIWNDHFIWDVVQAGVGHQVLKGNTIGNPLQIGQAGDTTEVLGGLTVDQATTLTGIVTAAAANLFGANGVLTHILGDLTVDGRMQFSKAGVAVAGSVAGTATLFFPVWGSGLKIALVTYVGYNSVNVIANPTWAFPSSIARGFLVSGNTGTMTQGMYSGAAVQTLSIITALGTAGAAGTSVGSTSLRANQMGQLTSTADNWQVSASGGAIDTFALLIGI